MTRNEVATMINGIGLPWAYYSFENSQSPNYPFIVYYYTDGDDKIADNSNYCRIEGITVELYTQQTDFISERLVENALMNHGIVYSKTRTYISQELAWQTSYESEVIITDGQ